jgi:hypothetical protein
MNTIALQFLSGCCFVSQGWRVAGYQCRMIFNVVLYHTQHLCVNRKMHQVRSRFSAAES